MARVGVLAWNGIFPDWYRVALTFGLSQLNELQNGARVDTLKWSYYWRRCFFKQLLPSNVRFLPKQGVLKVRQDVQRTSVDGQNYRDKKTAKNWNGAASFAVLVCALQVSPGNALGGPRWEAKSSLAVFFLTTLTRTHTHRHAHARTHTCAHTHAHARTGDANTRVAINLKTHTC